MKDAKYIFLFCVIGLALAWAVSGPLRRPPERLVGTPLAGGGSTLSPTGPMPAQEPAGEVYARGTIELASSASRSDAPPTLFLIARPAQGGPPVAVRKIGAPRFPFEFSLTTAHNMVGEDFFPGDLTIVARLDADGAAGPRQPGDWEGTAAAGEGSRDVRLVVEKPAP